MNAEVDLPLVRAATPDDYPKIMEMCRELYGENGALTVDWPTVELVIMNGINGNNAVIGVIGPPGNIEGMIYLQIGVMWYSQENILEELFSYVAEPFRKSKNSEALIAFARACSDRFKTPLLIGIISNKRTEAKVRLYKKQFGKISGAYFLYGAKTGDL